MNHGLSRTLTISGLAAVAIAIAACSGMSGTPQAVPAPNAPFVNAHPNTSPSATPTPIPMYKGEIIGTVVFPDGDSATGGQGQVVDGENCIGPIEHVPYHHHIHVALFVNNQQIEIPRALGMVPPWKVFPDNEVFSPKCKYYMHTHGGEGVIHLEYLSTPTQEPTLGQLFDVWGEPLNSGNVAGYTGSVQAYVNGIPYQYAIRNMGIGENHIQITLEVNSSVTPPVYNWVTY